MYAGVAIGTWREQKIQSNATYGVVKQKATIKVNRESKPMPAKRKSPQQHKNAKASIISAHQGEAC